MIGMALGFHVIPKLFDAVFPNFLESDSSDLGNLEAEMAERLRQRMAATDAVLARSNAEGVAHMEGMTAAVSDARHTFTQHQRDFASFAEEVLGDYAVAAEEIRAEERARDEEAEQRSEEYMRELETTVNGLKQQENEAKAAIETLQLEQEKLVEQLVRKQEEGSNPEELEALEAALFEQFLEQISGLKLSQPFTVRPGTMRHVGMAVMGKVSVGKSTLLNALFQKKCAKTGGGRTTETASQVGCLDVSARSGSVQVHVWDLPGDDMTYAYLSMNVVSFLVKHIHVAVVVYDKAVSDCERMVRLLHALGKHVLLVRNKLDDIPKDERSFEAVLEEDRSNTSTAVFHDPVMGVSARNVYDGAGDPYQWEAFRAMINQEAVTAAFGHE